ncbi:hypothetical protein CYMTET_10588 [Cymbomonas tetramitiformis]|uniref:Uncharacterized protein n=1 Tax=Cymbomonas tetramitiformis TaxID=36881 RepID=A0AAE0LEB5_9CHLO|nr:hypothetical protein CYMTET_10588 [Cymbomonas tetramitiformis]
MDERLTQRQSYFEISKAAVLIDRKKRAKMIANMSTPRGQTVVMGLIFLFVFTAYLMIQGYASKIYGDTLASNMALTLYAFFTVFCFVAPAITNKLGCRLTMMLGVVGYGALVASSLAYFNSDTLDWLVIIGGALCGVGAALLWTAQGRLILSYSDGTNGGELFALFWGIFNGSALIGGVLTYAYYAKSNSKGSEVLYIIFLAAIFGGAFMCLLLRNPRLGMQL